MIKNHPLFVFSLTLMLFTCKALTVLLCVLRGGVDPYQNEDSSGNAHLLLLHLWSDDLGRPCLLAERLEEATGGRLCSSVLVLCLQLVSATSEPSLMGQEFRRSLSISQRIHDFSLTGQVVCRVSSLVGSKPSV